MSSQGESSFEGGVLRVVEEGCARQTPALPSCWRQPVSTPKTFSWSALPPTTTTGEGPASKTGLSLGGSTAWDEDGLSPRTDLCKTLLLASYWCCVPHPTLICPSHSLPTYRTTVQNPFEMAFLEKGFNLSLASLQGQGK